MKNKIGVKLNVSEEFKMNQWEEFQVFLDYTIAHFESMKSWSDEDKLNEAVRAIEKEINRLRNKNLID